MSTDHDDQSSPTTPVCFLGPDATVLPTTASASSLLDHPTTETITEHSETITQSSSSSASRPSSLLPSDTPPHLILPIPTPSLNKSQSSVVFSHALVTSEDDWSSLPPEVATADISIARKYALPSIPRLFVFFATCRILFMSPLFVFPEMNTKLSLSRRQLCRDLLGACR